MHGLIECVAIALDRRLAGTARQLIVKPEFHDAVSCLGVKNGDLGGRAFTLSILRSPPSGRGSTCRT
jgi:hypothetical protein